MSRIPLAAAALLLGLAAAPAFAQSNPAPEDSAATRTMQQNQRAYIPSPARPQASQETVVKDRPAVAALPSIAGRRLELADRTAR